MQKYKKQGVIYKLRKKNTMNFKCKKQSQEDVLIGRAVKTTMHLFFDKWLFDNYDDTGEVLESYLLFERHRLDLGELNDIVTKWATVFASKDVFRSFCL